MNPDATIGSDKQDPVFAMKKFQRFIGSMDLAKALAPHEVSTKAFKADIIL
ncbi:hypothetical protein Csa_015399 [Cucumis sativus]|uniref:Uncharacterized protein n=1 Tax=Cucumis sativus TaxID=3659 RepID=A0A0A0KUA4_CUCSA|nr:hypothetical protein Csa_015399 [Cucumis sativus]